MKKRKLFLITLLLIPCFNIACEQGSQMLSRVLHSNATPISTCAYVIDQPSSTVCPVLVSGQGSVSQTDAIIQPSHTTRAHSNGHFLHSQNLDQTIFRVGHVIRTCITTSCTSQVGTTCDQLLLTKRGDIVEDGCFLIRYVPPLRGEPIDVNVSYGPGGLNFAGEIPADGGPIEVGDGGLMFQLRVVDPAVPADSSTVCEEEESGEDGGVEFQPSDVLQTRGGAVPMSTCLQGFGSFSQPYLINVKFRDSYTPLELTQRRIKVVLGNKCNSTELSSRVLSVIGSGVLVVSTPSSEPTSESPGTSPPTVASSPTTGTADTTGTGTQSLHPGVVVGIVLVFIIVLVIATLSSYLLYHFCCKRTKKDAERNDAERRGVLSQSVSGQTSRDGSIGIAENNIDQEISVISFAQDAEWSSHFREALVEKCGAIYNPDLTTSTKLDALNWTLSGQDFRLLCIVAAEDSDYPAESAETCRTTRTVESTEGDIGRTENGEVRGAATVEGEKAITLVESTNMQCSRLLQEMRSAGNFTRYKDKIVLVVRTSSGLDKARADDCWTLVNTRNGAAAEETAQRVLEAVQDGRNVRSASTPVRNGSTQNLMGSQEHKVESGHSKRFKGSTEQELEMKKRVHSAPISRRIKRMKGKKAAKSDKDLSDLKKSKRTKSDKDLSDSKEAEIFEALKSQDQKIDSLLVSAGEANRHLRDIIDTQEFQGELQVKAHLAQEEPPGH